MNGNVKHYVTGGYKKEWELKLLVLLAPQKQNKNNTARNHYQKVVLAQVCGVLRATCLLLS